MDQLSALNRLIAAFRTLPSVGTKTATSYAYSIINMKDSDVKNLIDAIQEAKDKIKAKGGKIQESVSRLVDYLVVGEAPGSKLREAEKLGVKILTE